MRYHTTGIPKKSCCDELFLSSYSYADTIWLYQKEWDDSLVEQLPKMMVEARYEKWSEYPLNTLTDKSPKKWILCKKPQKECHLDSTAIFAHLEHKASTYNLANLKISYSGPSEKIFVEETSIQTLITALFIVLDLDYIELSSTNSKIENRIGEIIFSIYQQINKSDSQGDKHMPFKLKEATAVFKPQTIWNLLTEPSAAPLIKSHIYRIEKKSWLDQKANLNVIENLIYLEKRLAIHKKKMCQPIKKRKRPLLAKIFFPRLD